MWKYKFEINVFFINENDIRKKKIKNVANRRNRKSAITSNLLVLFW